MKNNNGSLKLLARLAKKRLKGDEQFNCTTLFDAENSMAPPEDRKLVERIKYVLTNRKDTLTPLGELIDYEKFNQLSPLQREIYIFDLIDKYNYYKNIFERDKRYTQEHNLVV